jgi:hypothetical protein
MNYRSMVRCVVACLLFVTFFTVGAVAQGQGCLKCVNGGGTPGTLPIFTPGSTATKGVIAGRLGVFKGDIGGLIGWETHIDPNTTFAGVIGRVDKRMRPRSSELRKQALAQPKACAVARSRRKGLECAELAAYPRRTASP